MSRFETDLEVRFRDLDAMGHVNNAVYATYMEQARVEYYAEVLDVGLADIDTVIAHLEIDYERPIELGEAVVVRIDVGTIGRASFPMAYEIVADGHVAARAETIQVFWDRESGTSRPIPAEWRDDIEAFHGLDD